MRPGGAPAAWPSLFISLRDVVRRVSENPLGGHPAASATKADRLAVAEVVCLLVIAGSGRRWRRRRGCPLGLMTASHGGGAADIDDGARATGGGPGPPPGGETPPPPPGAGGPGRRPAAPARGGAGRPPLR